MPTRCVSSLKPISGGVGAPRFSTRSCPTATCSDPGLPHSRDNRVSVTLDFRTWHSGVFALEGAFGNISRKRLILRMSNEKEKVPCSRN